MKKYTPLISPKNLSKLYSIFGYAALGYYYEIIKKLYNTENLILEIKKIRKIAKEMKIKEKTLQHFIETCNELYDESGNSLLSSNGKYFWCKKLILEKYNNKIKQHKGRGRTKIPIEKSIKFKNAKNINLTQDQYDKLKYRYGAVFINNAIQILNTWLEKRGRLAKNYLNRNNYGHFRRDSWVITATKELLNSIEEHIIQTPDGPILINKVL